MTRSARSIITVGASEGLAASLAAVVDPGDEVVLAEPTYVAYVPDVVFAGGTPVFVPCHPEDGWQLDPDAVEAAITPRTRALFIGFPNNPTGAVLDPERLRALAAIAERHDLLVISDEIYDRLVYGGHRHEAFSAMPGMRDRTILLGGFSKAYAMTGWRIGYRLRPRGPHRGHREGAPVHHHVRAHGGAGCCAGGTGRSRG